MAVSLLAGYPLFRVVHPTTGLPLAGGKVYTYEQGTTTNKTAWTDAAKTVAHPNPVILDAAGEAVIYWDGEYKIRVDDASNATIRTMDDFNLQAAGADTITDQEGNAIVNGSFEIDTDGDNLPDGWDVVQNGTVEFDTGDANHGGQSLKFTSVGDAGGGVITSSSFFNVVQSRSHILRFGIKVDRTSGTCRLVIKIKWYTSNDTLISTTTAASTDYTASIAWANPALSVTAPATAVKAKLEITGISAGLAGVGSMWIDNVEFYKNNSLDLAQTAASQTVNGAVQLASTVTIGDTLTAQDIVPSADSSYDVGADATRVRTLYVDDIVVTNEATIGGEDRIRQARAYLNSSQTMTTSTTTYISWSDEDFDDDAMLDVGGSNPTRIVAPTGATRIRIRAQVTFPANATGYRAAGIITNRLFGIVDYYAAATSSHTTTILVDSGIIESPTGYYEVYGWQNSGGNLSVGQGTLPYVTWVDVEVLK